MNRNTNNDRIVTNELSPTMITGTTTLSELESMILGSEENTVTDGEANNSQFTTSEPVLMNVNSFEPEPMIIDIVENDTVREVQAFACELELMIVDLVEDVDPGIR